MIRSCTTRREKPARLTAAALLAVFALAGWVSPAPAPGAADEGCVERDHGAEQMSSDHHTGHATVDARQHEGCEHCPEALCDIAAACAQGSRDAQVLTVFTATPLPLQRAAVMTVADAPVSSTLQRSTPPPKHNS